MLFAVRAQLLGEHEFGRVRRQSLDVDLFDHAPGETAFKLSNVGLQAADHHVVELSLEHLHAAAEPLRIEDFEQRGKTVGVAVVGRGGQEQPVLETRRNVPDGPRGLRVDGVAGAARRRRVVRFVQDQQRSRGELAQPVTQPGGVRLVDQQAMRDQKPRMRRPGVHGEAPLAPHAGHVRAVEDREREAEARFHLVAPLLQHRRRTRHDDPVHAPAEQQFAGDQSGLDRLAEADVVGDEQVDPRQAQRLPQRFYLVGVDADSGAERRLEQVRIGRGDAVPRQRAQVGREQRRLVEVFPGDGLPAVVLQNPGVQLVLPEHGQRLALRVVVEAGQVDEGRLVFPGRLGNFLDEVTALADESDPARFGAGTAICHNARPPLLCTTCPVIQAASPLARNSTASATSSGVPARRSGVRFAVCSMPASSRNRVAMSVMVRPGATTLTRTPDGRWCFSRRRCRVLTGCSDGRACAAASR